MKLIYRDLVIYRIKFVFGKPMRASRHIKCLVEWNQFFLGMEPLYPLNIIERTFPHLREQREEAEKELRLNPKGEETFERSIDERAFDDENLYSDIHYEGASTGKHLSTFA